MVSHENVHISSITQTKQVVLMYIGMYIIYINNFLKEAMNLETNKGWRCLGRFGVRKKKAEMM